MAERKLEPDDSLLPWWLITVVVLFSVLMIPPEMLGVIWIPWQALSFTLSLAPIIALVGYLVDCRKQRQRPSFRGFWVLLRVVKKAKQESYRQTAKALAPGDAPRISVAVLAWLLIAFTWLAGNWSQVATFLDLLTRSPYS